jgi:hypothetical protein
MIEYAAPFDGSTQESRPPLWIVAAGSDGFWPITTLGWDESDRAYVIPGAASKQGRTPKNDIELGLGSESIAVVCCIWCLCCVVLLWRMFRGPLTSPADDKDGAWGRLWRSIAPELSSPLEFRRRFYLAASCACLLLFHVLLCAVWSLPMLETGRLGWRGHLALRSATALPLGFLLVALVTLIGATSRNLLGYWRGNRSCFAWKDELSLVIFVVLGASLAAAGVVWLIGSWMFLEPGKAMLDYARATAFRSGLSPLVPLFFTALAGLACTGSVARRLRRLEADGKEIATLSFDETSAPGLSALERQMRRLLGYEACHLPAPILAAALGLAFVLAAVPLCFWFAAPFEPPAFSFLFDAGFSVIYMGLAVEFGRFIYGWQILRRLLRRLSWHPIGRSFSELREKEDGLSLLPISQAGVAHPLGVIEHSLERARMMVRRATEAGGTVSGPLGTFLSDRSGDLRKNLNGAEESAGKAFDAFAKGDCDGMYKHQFEAHRQLSMIARDVSSALRRHRSDEPKAASCTGQPSSLPELVKAGERFLASHCVIFVTQALSQLQTLAALVTAGLLLMLLAATSYPFQPRNWILLFNWTVVLGAVGGTIAVFVQMSRNPLLSDLSGTEAGKTSWDRDLVLRVAIYGVLPILGLMGAQFPTTFGHLFVWLRTILGGH